MYFIGSSPRRSLAPRWRRSRGTSDPERPLRHAPPIFADVLEVVLHASCRKPSSSTAEALLHVCTGASRVVPEVCRDVWRAGRPRVRRRGAGARWHRHGPVTPCRCTGGMRTTGREAPADGRQQAKDGRSPGSRLVQLGLTDPMIMRRLQAGVAGDRLHRGVVRSSVRRRAPCRSTGRRSSPSGRMRVVSHESAAALHEMPGLPARAAGAHRRPRPAPSPGRRRRAPAVRRPSRTHRTIHGATSACRSRRRPGRSSTLPRSSIRPGCGSSSTSCVAARLVDDAGDRRLPRRRGPARASRAFGRWPRSSTLARGSPGARRPAGSSEALEAVFELAGLPAPTRQLRFPGRQDIDGCVDFGWPEARLIVEGDGRRWHTRIADLRRDRERDNQAARAGWQTLRFLHESIVADPADAGRAVREVYDLRSRLAA